MNYPLLKKSLDLNTAMSWMPTDSADDFFPDPIGWRDLRQNPEAFLARREHRMLQADALPHVTEYVPKKSGMLREAVWLHPCHRVLYLAILHRLLLRLDSRLSAEVYSYRADRADDPAAYPFDRKMERWKNFHNDFRRAALEPSAGAVLLTDLASYFDHIQVHHLGSRIESILAGTLDDGDREVVQFLKRLLTMWGYEGFGLPHNLDPSSFFGTVYLHNVDREMVANRYRYFRWIDDIRIVAKSRGEAFRALHDLQRALARHRLFPATDKTHIYERDSEEFNKLLEVDDDILISHAEEAVACASKKDLESIVDTLFPRLEYHSSKDGDDRKFRAFANRLLDISDFAEVERNITPRIHQFVIPRLKTHPERSDYWVKMLAARPTEDVTTLLKELLVDRPSLFDWQRFHLWRLATHLPRGLVPEVLFSEANQVSTNTLSENVAAQSIVFLGRHSDNTERENLFARLFTAQRSYVVQRAILIAIQEVPMKDHYYKRALETNSDHQDLVDYLLARDSPDYGVKARSMRKCAEEPKPIEHIITRGIGLEKGKVATFRLSGYDYDY
jgi:hypothetical protein